jgi:hypothetical protein
VTPSKATLGGLATLTATAPDRAGTAAADQRAPQRVDWVQELGVAAQLVLQAGQQILAADGAPGLPRVPGGERAPVRALLGARRDRGGQARVARGDLEVAQYRVRDRRYAPHLVDVRYGRGGRHGPMRQAPGSTPSARSISS